MGVATAKIMFMVILSFAFFQCELINIIIVTKKVYKQV